MAVKWIGQVARDLGMEPLDAIALLASKQSYPYNGLLDEDKVFLLRRWREGGRMNESGRLSVAPPPSPTAPPSPPPSQPVAAAPVVVAAPPAPGPAPLSLEPPPPPPPPPVPAPTGQSLRRKSDDEPTSKTSPFPTIPSGDLPPPAAGPVPPPIPGQRDKAEERTVILPPVPSS